MFNVAIERDVGEGRGGLQGRQGVGIERPLTILVAKDEFSALVRCGIYDYEGSKHICASRGVLMGFKEGAFFCEWRDVKQTITGAGRNKLP